MVVQWRTRAGAGRSIDVVHEGIVQTRSRRQHSSGEMSDSKTASSATTVAFVAVLGLGHGLGGCPRARPGVADQPGFHHASPRSASGWTSFPDRNSTVARFEELSGRPMMDFEWYETFAMVRSTAIMTRLNVLRQEVGKPVLLPLEQNPILDLLGTRLVMTDSSVATASRLVRLRAEDDNTGLLFEGQRWTWRQVVTEAQRRAELLVALRQDGPFHVGVLMENTPEYLFLLAGAALAGAVIVGVNPTRRGDELAADMRATDCQLLVTDSAMVDLVEGLDLGLGQRQGSRRRMPTPYRRRLDGPRPTIRGPARCQNPSPDDLFLLIFTSGSTGGPKAVRMSQGRAARSAAHVPFTSEDVLYCAMPLFHGNALSAAVFPAFASGATLALRRKFSASHFLPDIRETRATFFNSVGRAIAHIVATPPTENDRDHALKFVLGPETSARDKEIFTERFGVPLIEGYGSSENAIVLKPVLDARPGALGRASCTRRRGGDRS